MASRKRNGLYKASRGTLLPAPKRAAALPLGAWVLLGLGGFLAGRELAVRFLVKRG